MKKVLSLVLAFVLVLGMIPTFAADAAATGALNLYDNGFITGKDGATVDAKLDVNATLTRAELAALIAELYGAKEEAAAFAQPADFKDADTFQDWAKPYIAYAQENGWMNGLGDGTMFGPTQPVPANQLVAVLMNALGYEVTWNTVLADAAELGIIADGDSLTRGEAFEAMWVAVSEVPMNTEEGLTLGVKLGKLEPTVPVVTDLAVKSVVADNGRQVKVEFNTAVDADSIDTDTVKIFRGTSTTEETYAVDLSADGMVATFGLTANSMAQDSTVKVVLNGVVSAADSTKKLVDVTETATMKDTVSPSVLSAAFETSKTIVITLSEPLQLETNASNLHVMENILIDGNKLVGSIAQNYAKNTLTVTLGAKLPVGEHTIKVTGYRDFAGWLASDMTLTSSVISDTTAPAITSVEAGRTSVKVTFNEPVATLGNLTINGATYTTGTTTDNKTFKITLSTSNYLGLASLVQETVSYYGTVDMEGNVAGTASAPVKFVFVAADDTTAPTATVTLDSNNNVIVTFDEAVSNPGLVRVEKADGTLVVKDLVPTVKDATKNQYQVTAATAKLNATTSAANYNIIVSGSKDNSVRENTIVTFTTSVAAKDIVKPYALEARLTQTATTKVNSSGTTVADKPAQITVYFSEAMDIASLTEVNNYTVAIAGGGATPVNLGAISGVTLAAAADAKSVVITFPGTGTNGVVAGATSATQIYVLLVKDAAGNTIDTTVANAGYQFNEVMTATGSAGALAFADADGATTAYGDADVALVAKNQIKVGFNNPMSIIDPSEFVIYQTGTTTGVKAVGVSYTLNANSTVATITLNTDLTGDAKTASTDLGAAILFVKAAGNTKDMFGQKLAAVAAIDGSGVANATASIAIADYVAPSFVKVVKHETAMNKLVFTFSEPVTHAALPAAMLVKNSDGDVLGFNTGGAVAISGNEVTVTLNAAILSQLDQGSNSIIVSIPSGLTIQDLTNATALAPLADTVVTVNVDTAAPVATKTASTLYTSLTLTFNEPLYVTGTAVANGADIATQFTATLSGGATIQSALYNSATNAVVFTFDAGVAQDDTIAAKATLTDATGNASATTTIVTAGATAW